MYPATRFRTRLLPITADLLSCILFSSKLVEKFSRCFASSSVPIDLIYDGLIPMCDSSKFYTYNAVRYHNNIVCNVDWFFTKNTDNRFFFGPAEIITNVGYSFPAAGGYPPVNRANPRWCLCRIKGSAFKKQSLDYLQHIF